MQYWSDTLYGNTKSVSFISLGHPKGIIHVKFIWTLKKKTDWRWKYEKDEVYNTTVEDIDELINLIDDELSGI